MSQYREMLLEIVHRQAGNRDPDWTIVLPYLPPAQPNAGFKGSNPNVMAAIRRGIVDDCVRDVSALLREEGWHPSTPMIERAVILVTWTLPTRQRRDHDNLVAAMKPVYDALHPYYAKGHPHGCKDCRYCRLDGFLTDDSLETIGAPLYDYDYQRGVQRTTIEIWDQSAERLM